MFLIVILIFHYPDTPFLPTLTVVFFKNVTFSFENTVLCTPKVATPHNLKQVRFLRSQPKAQNKAKFMHVSTMDCDQACFLYPCHRLSH